jgi:hypothetical protein
MRTQTCRPKGAISLLLALSLVFVQSSELLASQSAAEVQAEGLRLTIVAGQGATHNVSQRVGSQVIVEVTDENNRPVTGAVIGFLLPETGPGGIFSNGINALSLVTDTTGRAVAGFTPNDIVGSFEMIVTASFQGRSATATVSQSNVRDNQNPVRPARTDVDTGTRDTGGISTSTIALIAAAAAGAVALGVVMGGGNDEGTNPGTPGSPNPGQPTIRIGLGGTPTVGAPGGWQSSLKRESPLPKWRP